LLCQFLHRVHDGLCRYAEYSIVVAVHKGHRGDEILLAITGCDGYLPVLDVEEKAVEDGHRILGCHDFAGSGKATVERRTGNNEFHIICVFLGFLAQKYEIIINKTLSKRKISLPMPKIYQIFCIFVLQILKIVNLLN